MEPIESSETSAYINTLTPGSYPKEKKLQVTISLRFVRMEQVGWHWIDFHEIRYLSFSKIYRENSSFINIWQE